MRKQMGDPYTFELRNLFFELTTACNEHCFHCGSNCAVPQPDELTTEEYAFTEVITYSNLKQFLGIDLPWTETSYIASYDGVIRAGIDFAAVKVASEQLDDGVHLTVTLPKSKIQSTEIDPDSFILYSEKTGLGNPLSASDFNQSLTELEHDAQKHAVDKGVLTRADEQAKLLIERFIQSVLVEDTYTLDFA